MFEVDFFANENSIELGFPENTYICENMDILVDCLREITPCAARIVIHCERGKSVGCSPTFWRELKEAEQFREHNDEHNRRLAQERRDARSSSSHPSSDRGESPKPVHVDRNQQEITNHEGPQTEDEPPREIS